MQLRRLRVHFSKIGHVFISHLHGDHCFGLIGMISTFGLLGRTAKLHIHANEQLEEMLNSQMALFCRDLGYEVVFHSIDASRQDVIYEDRSLTVETIPLCHRMPTCGFLFREKPSLPHIRRDMLDFYQIPVSQIQNIKNGADWTTAEGEVVPNSRLVLPADPVRSYAYCSDTRYIPQLHEMLKGVSTLYHESTYGDDNLTMAEKYFSRWPKGKPVKEPEWKLPTFDKQVVKKVKQTPIKVGLMIFPGVKQNDKDELLLDVMSEIISGGNGRLDELATEGKLMSAQLIPLTLQDAGTNVILYIPKLLGQKHEAAEELIWAALDSVKQGRFSDELLESIKMNNYVSRLRQLEGYRSIASLLQSLETSGSSYEQWLDDNERLQNITREDIMQVAAKYFDRDHCTLIRSNMGFPKKDAAIKPDWDHLDAQNQGAQSPFAKRIANRKVKPIKPQIIDFEKDVEVIPVSEHCNLYATKNPKNDLFSLNICYHYGTADNHNLEVASEYFSQLT